ncbi:hypothetical protein BDZ88DRAFT_425728 [Geranomyces variabilis]|nr:hypothetical protein BDZ88DRAFT_425728 [Geranomyces variabilis]
MTASLVAPLKLFYPKVALLFFRLLVLYQNRPSLSTVLDSFATKCWRGLNPFLSLTQICVGEMLSLIYDCPAVDAEMQCSPFVDGRWIRQKAPRNGNKG